jgi:hypothetical protein
VETEVQADAALTEVIALSAGRMLLILRTLPLCARSAASAGAAAGGGAEGALAKGAAAGASTELYSL